MLTKEEWFLAESGDNCIAYSEFEYNTRALISTYTGFIFSVIFYYICFLGFKWILASKIILGIVNLVNLPCVLLIPVAILGIFDIKSIKNKWLMETRYVLIYSTIVSSVSVFCYIYFVFLEHPLPNFLNNFVAFILITSFLFWFKNNLILYKNTDIPEEWLIKNGLNKNINK